MILEIHDLSKYYGSKKALKNFNSDQAQSEGALGMGNSPRLAA